TGHCHSVVHPALDTQGLLPRIFLGTDRFAGMLLDQRVGTVDKVGALRKLDPRLLLLFRTLRLTARSHVQLERAALHVLGLLTSSAGEAALGALFVFERDAIDRRRRIVRLRDPLLEPDVLADADVREG